MLKVSITIFGKTYKDAADASEHVTAMLKLKAPSEFATWEDGSHVSFDVEEVSDDEYKEWVNFE
jgi:hypothetical protein